jgi:uncharacterized membrane protein YhiD involved in acid resistance
MILKREGVRIEGLTTAAGLWAVGSIGLAIGAGMYLLGTVTAALVGLILAAESILRLDERLERRRADRIGGADHQDRSQEEYDDS